MHRQFSPCENGSPLAVLAKRDAQANVETAIQEPPSVQLNDVEAHEDEQRDGASLRDRPTLRCVAGGQGGTAPESNPVTHQSRPDDECQKDSNVASPNACLRDAAVVVKISDAHVAGGAV